MFIVNPMTMGGRSYADPTLIVRYDMRGGYSWKDGANGNIYNVAQNALHGERRRTPQVLTETGKAFMQGFGHDGVDWAHYDVADSHNAQQPPYKRLPLGASDRTFIAVVRTPNDRVDLKHIFMYGATNMREAFGLGLQGGTGYLEVHAWGDHTVLNGVAAPPVSTDCVLAVVHRNTPPVGKTRMMFGIKYSGASSDVFDDSGWMSQGDMVINTQAAWGLQVGIRIAGFEPWNVGGRMYDLSAWNVALTFSELVTQMNLAAIRAGI